MPATKIDAESSLQRNMKFTSQKTLAINERNNSFSTKVVVEASTSRLVLTLVEPCFSEQALKQQRRHMTMINCMGNRQKLVLNALVRLEWKRPA